MRKPTFTARVMVTMSPEMRNQVEREAEKTGDTYCGFIRNAVRQHISTLKA